MNSIALSSCDRCKPEKWRRGKEAVGHYWCLVCRKHVKYVMKKRKGGKEMRLGDVLTKGFDADIVVKVESLKKNQEASKIESLVYKAVSNYRTLRDRSNMTIYISLKEEVEK